MTHIEIKNGKETLVANKSIKVCMKIENPKETLQVFKKCQEKISNKR